MIIRHIGKDSSTWIDYDEEAASPLTDGEISKLKTLCLSLAIAKKGEIESA